FILNNYTDMRDFSYPSDGGCSTWSVRTEQEYIAGQTWDMHASATPYILHLTIQDAIGPIHILTVTGCLGLSGVNPQGVSVFINNMHCSETAVQLMWPALVRSLLQKPTAQDALNFLKENLPCSGHNYLICDPTESINVETTGLRYDVTHQSQGPAIYFHT